MPTLVTTTSDICTYMYADSQYTTPQEVKFPTHHRKVHVPISPTGPWPGQTEPDEERPKDNYMYQRVKQMSKTTPQHPHVSGLDSGEESWVCCD